MNRSKRYSPEVRERAVRIVFEHQGEHESHWATACALLVDEALRARGLGQHRLALPHVGRIAPHPGLVTMQQGRKLLRVVDVGRSDLHRVNQLRARIHPKVPLHAKIPLVALLRLMHLRVAPPGLVLRRHRRADNRRIHNRPGPHLEPLRLQATPNRTEYRLAQPVGLEQVAELAHRRLIGHRLPPKANTREPEHRVRVVKRLFHRWVGQIEPVLKKMDLEHALQTHRWAARAFAFRVHWLYQRARRLPGHHPFPLVEKLLPAGALGVTFEAAFGKSLLWTSSQKENK